MSRFAIHVGRNDPIHPRRFFNNRFELLVTELLEFRVVVSTHYSARGEHFDHLGATPDHQSHGFAALINSVCNTQKAAPDITSVASAIANAISTPR